MGSKTTVAMLVAALTLTSCTQTGSMAKAQVGAVVGALTGAAAGAGASHDDGNNGALVAARTGGLVGARIGKELDEQDRARLAASTRATIATGAPQSWSNPDSGVSAKTEVKSTVARREQRQIAVLKGKVQQVPPLEFIGEDYTALKAANVRGGPGTDYAVVGRLGIGANTRVVGKVVNQPWYMVSENNIGSGFVSAVLLKPAAAPAAAAPTFEAPQVDVAKATVAGTSTCRVVTQQITQKDGKTVSEDVEACRGPNGWEITEA
jgi:surface antigen